MLRPALLCGPLFLSMLNYSAANCPRMAAPCCASVECPAALFYISAQPKPSIFGWLFITHLLLVINGELGQFALYHQHIMWLPCFCFPAVPHFNNRYLRVTCSTSRASTATSTAPSTNVRKLVLYVRQARAEAHIQLHISDVDLECTPLCT